MGTPDFHPIACKGGPRWGPRVAMKVAQLLDKACVIAYVVVVVAFLPQRGIALQPIARGPASD